MNARLARNLIAVLIVVVFWAVLLLTAGCSTVSLSRTDDGVTLEYRTLMTKIQAPSVCVDKEGEYSACFNAESKSSDLEIMRDIITAVKTP